MKVTDVKIKLYNSDNKTLKGFADITIDEELVIKGLKIIEGKKGDFISFPAVAGGAGQYYDQVYPIKASAREEITDAVLDAYDRAKEEKQEERSTRSARRRA